MATRVFGIRSGGVLRLACVLVVSTSASWLVFEPARAQVTSDLNEQQIEAEGLASQPPPGQLSATLGAALVSADRYAGADRRHIRLRPLFEIRYGDIFLSNLGLGWNAINLDHFHAGPLLGYEGGRRSDDLQLTGLGDIPGSVTGGAFARYRFSPFEVSLVVRQAISHSSNGLDGVVRFDLRAPLGSKRLLLTIGPHLNFADSQYEQTRFGVTALQSEQSGFPVFTARGGLEYVGFRAGITYLSADHLLLRAFADLNRLTGDAAHSPIVQNRTQSLFGVGVAYRF